MSTRWYPIYQRGNPQLRVFLPNFWMKIIKPNKEIPSNVVKFGCSMEMTKYDVKNYLEKIYNIPIVDLRLQIKTGRFRKALGANYIVKDDDLKIAIVTLPPNEKFNFPDLFAKEGKDDIEEMKEQLDDFKKDWQKNNSASKHRPGVPTWFNI